MGYKQMHFVVNKTRRAFTLLELIVVIVILGILAGLAVPGFSSIKSKSNESVARHNAQVIVRTALHESSLESSALSAAYINEAGQSVDGYSAATHSVTMGSGSSAATASINTTTGVITMGSAESAAPHSQYETLFSPPWYESNSAAPATNISFYSGSKVSFDSPNFPYNWNPDMLHVRIQNISGGGSAWLNNSDSGIMVVSNGDGTYHVVIDTAMITAGTVDFSDLTNVGFNLNAGSYTISKGFRFTN